MVYTIGSKVLNDWEIVRLIGEGAFGKVYEIQKNNYGVVAKAALKVIHIPKNPSDVQSILQEGMDEVSVTTYFQGFVQEIVSEISIMTSLKGYANIVSCEDYSVIEYKDTMGWDILIRMELLTPMQSYLTQHTMSEADVVKLGRDLCQALAVCQRNGLVHRDIKPENIFVNEAGQFKLGDFGIARTAEKTVGGLSKKGTLNYMAPEVYLGKPYGPNVDIYSVGLVLYKLMNNNRLPFLPPIEQPIRYEDRENALRMRMNGEKIPMPACAGKEFAAVILKACAYETSERYHTAEEMLEDLYGFEMSFSHFTNIGQAQTMFLNDENKTFMQTETMENEVAETEMVETEMMETEVVENAMPETEETVLIEENEPRKKWIVAAVVIVPILIATLLGGLLCSGRRKRGNETQVANDIKTSNEKVLERDEKQSEDINKVVVEQSNAENDVKNENENTQTENVGAKALWSAWGEWQEKVIKEKQNCQVETKKQYSSRSVMKQQIVSEWGEWSSWNSTQEVPSEHVEVESRKVWLYELYRCECFCGFTDGAADVTQGMIDHVYEQHARTEQIDGGQMAKLYSYFKGKINTIPEWMKCEEKTYTSTQELTLDTTGQRPSCTVDSKQWIVKDTKTGTQYRKRTRTVSEQTIFGEWSEYIDKEILANDKTEVRTRTLYRCRTRK